MRLFVTAAIMAAAPLPSVAAVIDWDGPPATQISGTSEPFFSSGVWRYQEAGFDIEVDAPEVVEPTIDGNLGFLNNTPTGFGSITSYTFTRSDGGGFSLKSLEIPSVFTSASGFVTRERIDPATGDFIETVAQDSFFVTWDNVALSAETADGGAVSRTFSAWHIQPGDEPVGNGHFNTDSIFDADDYGRGFGDLTSLTLSTNADVDLCHPTNFTRPDPLLELESFCTGAPFDLETRYTEYDASVDPFSGPQNDTTSLFVSAVELGEPAVIPLPAGGLSLAGGLAMLAAGRRRRQAAASTAPAR